MKTKLILAFWLIAYHSQLFAQNAQLNKANKHFRNLNYQAAIELYEKILKKGTKPTALFNLAASYRKIGDMQNAEKWYGQAILHPDAPSDVFVHFGQALLANNKPRDAQRQFEKYLSLQPSDSRAKNLLRACNDTVRQELLNTGSLYLVKTIDELNTPNDDFGGTFYQKGIIFASEKDTGGIALRRSAWTGRPFLDLFFANVRLLDEDKMDLRFGKPEEFAPELKTKFHDAAVAFGEDQKIIYVTRNNIDKKKARYSTEGIVNVKIIQAKKAGNIWMSVDNVAFNSNNHSVMHPALTPDGYKMYFSSDMEGGFGGMDLYVSYNEAGKWSAPINLGPSINTEGDEVFPYVSKDGLLYFASDGHPGIGGLDVYYSRATRGVWAPVTNLGAPLNSNKDDFGYSIDSTKKYGFISSNRDGGKGLTDIYLFTRLSVDVEVLVFDKATGRGLENVTVTSDCFPKTSYTTNVDGKVYLELPVEKACNFKLKSDEYGEKELVISTKGYAIGAQLSEQVPIELGEGLKFAVKGTVLDKSNNQPLAGATLSLLNSSNPNTPTLKSAEDGTFFFELSPNTCYVVRANSSKHFTGTTNFCTKGLYKSDTLEVIVSLPPFIDVNNPNGKPNKGGAGGTTNRLDTGTILGVENIYHEYDKPDIKVESSTGLQMLLDLLKASPDMSVEIRSHTDARGNDAYNMALSTKRAKAISDYLVKNGIPAERLTYKGMGETELVNGCADGVVCTEEQHQQNRRTEFRVLK